jgi:signal transduction histidine kinase
MNCTTIGASLPLTLDFKALSGICQTFNSTLRLEELMTTLCQTLRELSEADRSALILYQNDVWQVCAIADREQSCLKNLPLEQNQSVPFGLIQAVQFSMQAITLEDWNGEADHYLVQHRPESALGLPILNQGNLVGILYLENRLTRNVFTTDRIFMLNFLCTQAAIALKNARLYAREQQRSEELRSQATLLNFRASVDEILVCGDNLQKMMQDCTQVIVNHLDATFARIWTLNAQENCLELQASAGLYTHIDGAHSRVPVGQFKIGLIAEECRPHLTNQVLTDPRVGDKAWAAREGLVAFAGYPLLVNDQLLGVIALFSRQPLSDQVLTALAVAANQIALGIRRKQAEMALQQSESQLSQKSQELAQVLSNLQHTQLKMVQSEKMSALGNLVAGVAHEINNPIGCIVGNVSAVRDSIHDLFNVIDLYQQKFPQPGAEIEEELEAIDLEYLRKDLPKLVKAMKDGGDRIKSISRSLSNFSRSDTDAKQQFNLHEGIDSTVMILRHRLKANEHRPEIEVITEYGKIPMIYCFPGQLNQVFMNILANAIDALDELIQGKSFAEIQAQPNQIKIQTTAKNNQVRITIADNGKGMPEDVRERIFDNLFTTKKIGKGTGLGLAIAQQIMVEKHGGAIEVNSKLGKGTEFIVTLPLN